MWVNWFSFSPLCFGVERISSFDLSALNFVHFLQAVPVDVERNMMSSSFFSQMLRSSPWGVGKGMCQGWWSVRDVGEESVSWLFRVGSVVQITDSADGLV